MFNRYIFNIRYFINYLLYYNLTSGNTLKCMEWYEQADKAEEEEDDDDIIFTSSASPLEGTLNHYCRHVRFNIDLIDFI